jgi:putative pyoverdin transport system ATP-binding/permease protein
MFFKKYNALLKEKNSFSLIGMIILGLLGGISGTAMIAIVNKVVQLDPQNKTFYFDLFVGFIAVLGVHFIVQTIYQISLIKLSHRMIWKLRMLTLDNVRRSDYLKYLTFGSNRIHAVLTRDAYELSQFSQKLSSVIVAIVSLLTGLVYLMWLTPVGCIITLVLAMLIIAVHFLTVKKINAKVTAARKVEEQYNKHFLSVLEGIKELKLDHKKSNDLFNNYVIKTGEKAQSMWAGVSTSFYVNGLLGNFFFYVLIAFFLFILPFFKLSILSNSFEYILITLYLMGPTQTIVGSISSFSFANKALEHFSELKALEEAKEKIIEETSANLQLKKISFHDLSFQYRSETGEENFKIGPLNFSLSKGQIVFLTGGNGSGKSTFIRLLTGLYLPNSGHIEIDGVRISNTQVSYYRSLFSAIYTDNYLFDVILGSDSNQDEKMNEILFQLGLSSKVKCKDHIFSTIDLSYGQKKRVSLAVSLLEDKPIYVFDELAANQDTEFKVYFYNTVLQELKDRGKIVLVVTHDEKYFHIADKHYKMEDGQILTNRILHSL